MSSRKVEQIIKPSEVTPEVGWFDRFASKASFFVSRAPFFALCVLMVILWVPTIFFMEFDVSQLLINTSTTIITFLMVALLQNSQTRNDQAVQHKLNAIADGLADLMAQLSVHDERTSPRLKKDIRELKEAVGLEMKESTS